jgi:Pyridoxamine 5'-phosphate oxidase
MRWSGFAAACPELAGLAREWIVERHILMLGTLRADGSPRISAVECDLAGDDLYVGMIWRSAKALDLLRDPRMTVHSVPPGKDNPDGDLKLYGRAVAVEGQHKREYQKEIFQRLQWRPDEPYHCFALDLDGAGFVRFRDEGRDVWHWRAGGSLRKERLTVVSDERQPA